jgi:hypothetical protein
MNIFEGSRRIVKAIAALWVVGFAVAAFFTQSTLHVQYKVLTFNGAPYLQSKSNCGDDDAFEWGAPIFTTPKGTVVSPSLCFEARGGFRDKDGRELKLVPYKVDRVTDKIWGNEKYSTDVSNYTKEYARKFSAPVEDYPKLDQMGKANWWSTIIDGAALMVGGLVFLFVTTFIIGWVARGFMGIPKGKDSKE